MIRFAIALVVAALLAFAPQANACGGYNNGQVDIAVDGGAAIGAEAYQGYQVDIQTEHDFTVQETCSTCSLQARDGLTITGQCFQGGTMMSTAYGNGSICRTGNGVHANGNGLFASGMIGTFNYPGLNAIGGTISVVTINVGTN
jgi:hypothetical protein